MVLRGLLLVLLGLLMVGCRRDRAGAQTACFSNVKNLSTALDMYRNDFQQLPASIEALEAARMIGPLKKIRCDWDNQPGCSYRYYANREKRPKVGEHRLMVHCRARHPEQLRSADGDRDKGRQAVLTEDLKVVILDVAAVSGP